MHVFSKKETVSTKLFGEAYVKRLYSGVNVTYEKLKKLKKLWGKIDHIDSIDLLESPATMRIAHTQKRNPLTESREC